MERRWNQVLLDNQAPLSTTVVSLRASQNGQYITGALPTEITFGQNETRKVIEFQTVDDSAFSENGFGDNRIAARHYRRRLKRAG